MYVALCGNNSVPVPLVTVPKIFIWGHILGVKQSFWGRIDKAEPTGSQGRRGRLVLWHFGKQANFPP